MKLFKKGLAEFIGTFVLVLFGCGAAAISLFLASVHYILGFIAFAVLAMYLPKISAKLNITE